MDIKLNKNIVEILKTEGIVFTEVTVNPPCISVTGDKSNMAKATIVLQKMDADVELTFCSWADKPCWMAGGTLERL